MHNTNQQSLCLENAGVDHFIAGFRNPQDSAYSKIADKISTHLHGSKADVDYVMIETFYFRLLPVTYRDWKCKQ